MKRFNDSTGFTCKKCGMFVVINEYIGTKNRNHCNFCLYSRHVDKKTGDRKSPCKSVMKPVGLTFKFEGFFQTGELMLIHECCTCCKISINRIAADDNSEAILQIFEQSTPNINLRLFLNKKNIFLLETEDKEELLIQLFGK